jgi:hypothetical protein
MKRAREQRENERKAAFDRLNSAKESEKLLAARVDEEMQKLSASRYQLAEAKANLARTESELQRLDDEKLELVCSLYPLVSLSLNLWLGRHYGYPR